VRRKVGDVRVREKCGVNDRKRMEILWPVERREM
jgi:hypothetical protein